GVAMIGQHTDAPADTLRKLAAAAGDREPRRFELSLQKPSRRVLRWQTRSLDAGTIDELVDLTAEADQAEAREKLVRVDALTELANRRGGEEELGREISWCLRSGSPLCVAL